MPNGNHWVSFEYCQSDLSKVRISTPQHPLFSTELDETTGIGNRSSVSPERARALSVTAWVYATDPCYGGTERRTNAATERCFSPPSAVNFAAPNRAPACRLSSTGLKPSGVAGRDRCTAERSWAVSSYGVRHGLMNPWANPGFRCSPQ